jgi:hypothetical protein
MDDRTFKALCRMEWSNADRIIIILTPSFEGALP